MNRKMIVSLCLIVNAAVALSLSRNHLQRPSVTSVVVDDGTQPPVPPKGPGMTALVADGTQPPVPPKGPGSEVASSISQQQTNGAKLAALAADGTQPPVPPK